MTDSRISGVERRLLRLDLGLTAAGGLAFLWIWGWHTALSFAAGSLLAGANLAWQRSSIAAIVTPGAGPARTRILAGFFLRLLLIPLGLYAMIRFLFLDILAAVAGFAVLVGCVLLEGVLEAFGSSPN